MPLRILAALVVAFGLLLSGCATRTVTVVNGFNNADLAVSSSNKLKKEVVLAPREKAQFPLGTTLFFTVVKDDDEIGFFSKNFPKRSRDTVFVAGDAGKIDKGNSVP